MKLIVGDKLKFTNHSDKDIFINVEDKTVYLSSIKNNENINSIFIYEVSKPTNIKIYDENNFEIDFSVNIEEKMSVFENMSLYKIKLSNQVSRNEIENNVKPMLRKITNFIDNNKINQLTSSDVVTGILKGTLKNYEGQNYINKLIVTSLRYSFGFVLFGSEFNEYNRENDQCLRDIVKFYNDGVYASKSQIYSDLVFDIKSDFNTFNKKELLTIYHCGMVYNLKLCFPNIDYIKNETTMLTLQSVNYKLLFNFEDIFGYYGKDKSNRHIVALSGSKTITDFVQDLDVELVDFKGTKVGKGFLNIHDQIITQIENIIQTNNIKEINLFGHSLGGAVSLLVATSLLSKNIKINVSTVGQPKVGNKDFANLINSSRIKYAYYTNENDIVPVVPPNPEFVKIRESFNSEKVNFGTKIDFSLPFSSIINQIKENHTINEYYNNFYDKI